MDEELVLVDGVPSMSLVSPPAADSIPSVPLPPPPPIPYRNPDCEGKLPPPPPQDWYDFRNSHGQPVPQLQSKKSKKKVGVSEVTVRPLPQQGDMNPVVHPASPMLPPPLPPTPLFFAHDPILVTCYCNPVHNCQTPLSSPRYYGRPVVVKCTCNQLHICKEPPPPPPPPLVVPPPPIMNLPPGFRFDSHTPEVALPQTVDVSDLIPVVRTCFAEEWQRELKTKLVRVTPFKRNVLLTVHPAGVADFDEVEWILQYGTSGKWYKKPGRKSLRTMEIFPDSDELSDSEVDHGRLAKNDCVRVWASAALVTPLDYDVDDCESSSHWAERDDESDSEHECGNARTDALESASLVYYLVLSTFESAGRAFEGTTGKQAYSLVKCGSRAAAVAEALSASSINGWSVDFCCVFRHGETFGERTGPVKRVEELWEMGEEAEDENTIKVFY